MFFIYHFAVRTKYNKLGITDISDKNLVPFSDPKINRPLHFTWSLTVLAEGLKKFALAVEFKNVVSLASHTDQINESL